MSVFVPWTVIKPKIGKLISKLWNISEKINLLIKQQRILRNFVDRRVREIIFVFNVYARWSTRGNWNEFYTITRIFRAITRIRMFGRVIKFISRRLFSRWLLVRLKRTCREKRERKEQGKKRNKRERERDGGKNILHGTLIEWIEVNLW